MPNLQYLVVSGRYHLGQLLVRHRLARQSPIHAIHMRTEDGQKSAQHVHAIGHASGQRRMELRLPLRRHIVLGAAQLLGDGAHQRNAQIEIGSEHLLNVLHEVRMIGGEVAFAHQSDELGHFVALHFGGVLSDRHLD